MLLACDRHVSFGERSDILAKQLVRDMGELPYQSGLVQASVGS
jgi:hypothetical protein